MSDSIRLNRREFARTAGSAAAASLLFPNLPQSFAGNQRRRYAIVGTGIRGTSMWGAELFKHYSDVIEFVGLCDLTSVDFSWYLDVFHGADYFRRWHRLKSKGGSLWVHKATHHST
jgi:predicted dehydrogenase